MSKDARRNTAGLVVTVGLLIAGLVPAGMSPSALGSLRDGGLNLADTQRMERSYYERILNAGRRFDRIGGEESARGGTADQAAEPPFEAGRLALPVDDLREFVLKPNLSETLRGGTWTTNALGLRDREYDRAKPAGTLRIALLGDSIGSGWGVDDGQAFESRVEASLDSTSRASGGPAVEVVNFSVPGHAPGQRWEGFAREGWSMSPDLVLYEATPADPGWDVRRLRGLLPRGLGWDAPQYREALGATRLRRDGDFAYYKRAIGSHSALAWRVLGNVYRTIVAESHARGVPAAWILIPRVGKAIEPGERDRMVRLARDAGFDAVFDLSDAYDGLDPDALAIAPDDYHPNADGHARLAARIEQALRTRPDLLQIRTAGGPGDDGR